MKPCPFCGGEAEQDFERAYCMFPSGKLDTAAAIYCIDCHADMMICRADTPDYSNVERMEILVKNWNERK